MYLRERQATLLCPLNGRHDEHEARRLGASLHRALVDALDTPLVTVGVGTVARSPREIPRTYQEAEQALDLAERALALRLEGSERGGLVVLEAAHRAASKGR